jgi:hypothetical protein
MDHAELASKTRELLEWSTLAVNKNYIPGGLGTAVAALQPSPLDKLRQTLREQGWRLHESGGEIATAHRLMLQRAGSLGHERWVHECQP